jgi:TPR repeat protein
LKVCASTALKLLRPLVDQDVAEAEFYLGLMYAQGQGVPQDDPAALSWYRKAADKGDADAQFYTMVGVCCRATPKQ